MFGIEVAMAWYSIYGGEERSHDDDGDDDDVPGKEANIGWKRLILTCVNQSEIGSEISQGKRRKRTLHRF